MCYLGLLHNKRHLRRFNARWIGTPILLPRISIATLSLQKWENEEFAPGNWIKLKGVKDGKSLICLIRTGRFNMNDNQIILSMILWIAAWAAITWYQHDQKAKAYINENQIYMDAAPAFRLEWYDYKRAKLVGITDEELADAEKRLNFPYFYIGDMSCALEFDMGLSEFDAKTGRIQTKRSQIHNKILDRMQERDQMQALDPKRYGLD